jgi:tRNA-splicing endonuclease subunit Sen2
MRPTACRSKGWLPRSGLLYGADYVLYQLHPAVVHSDYATILVPLQGRAKLELNWQETQIANRLISQVCMQGLPDRPAARVLGAHHQLPLGCASQVGKRLVLLYIHSDEPLEGEVCSSPACLEHVTAEERMVARWVPDATRD